MPHSSFQSFPSAREVSGGIQQRAIHCARRQIHGSHEILGSRNRDVDSTLWKASEAPVHVNQTPSDSHTNRTKSGIDDLWPGFHSPPCQPPISSSSPGWPPLCQPNGRRLPTVWGAMSQGVVASSETIVGYAECLWDGRGEYDVLF